MGEKFTPGPWFSHGVGVYNTQDTDESRALIALVYSCADGSTLGNTHLIAAAPEMFDALDAVWTEIDNARRDGLKHALPVEHDNELFRMIRAALAKARGEA